MLFGLSASCSKSNRIQLPDGRELEVWTTTYGTNHIAPGQLFRRLDKILPKIFRTPFERAWPETRLPVQFVDRPFRPSIEVWFRFVGNSATNRTMINILAEDSQKPGNVAGSMVWPSRGPTPPTLPDGPRLSLYSFPRRESELTLNLLLANEITHRFEPLPAPIRVKNPRPFRGSLFRGETLPARQTNGEIRAELVELTIHHQRFLRPGDPIRMAYETRFKIKAETITRLPATVVRASVEDAGGNQIWEMEPPGATKSREATEFSFGLGQDLGSDETVYKLKVEVEPPASSTNSEVLELAAGTAESASTDGSTPTVGRSKLVPGLSVEELRVVDGEPLHWVTYEVIGRPRDARVRLIDVRDARGRAVGITMQSNSADDPSVSPDGERAGWTLDVPEGTKLFGPLSLKFQVIRTAWFDFFAAPRHLTNDVVVPK